ncbi:MAG: sigma-70 family RNA polymerase sigma factor [Gemmatimonadetes bacterium]|nr:sigma-70 family RNA polymerase sigma factor [Gemmatimonadota bacterium]
MAADPRDDAALDAALIARWQRGDERAARELVDRHASAVARFVSSLGAREEADEVTQDTFVRAFGALETFRADSALRTWLFTIARRLVLDRRRARRRRGDQVEVTEEDVITTDNPLDSLVADETRKRLLRAVDRLTKTQREVFTLRVTEGLSYREIAEITGSTEGAARVHYHHAMRSVKEFLDA